MCEMLIMKSPDLIPVEEVLRSARLLDRFGVAGFGWGLAWQSEDGRLQSYRSVQGVLDDSLASQILMGLASRLYLVHLRRPSQLTSISHQNAQPYMDDCRSMAFAHNGYFRSHAEKRSDFSGYRGTSDSEVGFKLYQKLTEENMSTEQSLVRLHSELGGKANIAVIHAAGDCWFYGGNEDNRAYSFLLGNRHVISTALHSHDLFLFETIFPQATRIERVENKTLIPLSTT